MFYCFGHQKKTPVKTAEKPCRMLNYLIDAWRQTHAETRNDPLHCCLYTERKYNYLVHLIKRETCSPAHCVFSVQCISNIVSPIFHFLSAKAFYQSIHSNHSLKHTTGNATSLFFNEIPLKTRLQSLPSGLSLKC